MPTSPLFCHFYPNQWLSKWDAWPRASASPGLFLANAEPDTVGWGPDIPQMILMHSSLRSTDSNCQVHKPSAKSWLREVRFSIGLEFTLGGEDPALSSGHRQLPWRGIPAPGSASFCPMTSLLTWLTLP